MEKIIGEKNIAAEAEALERLTIQLIREKKWDALESMLHPACQFVTNHGSFDRASAMTLMKEMCLGDVAFKDFKVTQAQDNLMISFWISAIEYCDGVQQAHQYSPRLSVWRKDEGQWKCIAYADLISAKS